MIAAPPTRSRLGVGAVGRRGSESTFWAVTAYFNPARWRVRRSNYQIFRRHLGLPLLTVELTFDGSHELTAADAEVLVRPAEGDVLWQKERLLNVGLAALPSHVTHVAWLDCDLVFERADWWRGVLAELRRSAVVQVFDRVVNLGPGARFDESSGNLVAGSPQLFDRELAIAAWLGAFPDRAPVDGRFPSRRHRGEEPEVAATGGGWAASRETLARVGLLDTLVLGGADAAMVAGFLGSGERYLRGLPAYRRTSLGDGYARWADAAHSAIKGRVGAAPGRVFHLWHGDLDLRGYDVRHRILAEHDFRPETDLRLGNGGAWLWATAKPALHRQVERYFSSRCEDDAEAVAERPLSPDVRAVVTDRA